MNASVLIVGEDGFRSHLLNRVRGLSALTLQTVLTAGEAEDVIQMETPEIVILQANSPENWTLCHALKQQRSFSALYCILVETRFQAGSPADASVLDRYFGLMTIALETGADAYVWLTEDGIDQAPASDEQARLFQAQLRLALRQVQAYRELSRANDLLSAIALSDALTQLGNRRAFDWELPRQIYTACEQALPLSLLVLDIDYFKAVNDKYGHLIGDQVLQMVAERLSSNMRFYETPFRYGGEEFVVILSNTQAEEAVMIAQRLRRLIGEKPFVVSETLKLSVTVSVGVACLESEDDDKGISLLDRADQSLLRAKAAGRNQVVQS
ncbi:MAG TPA: diguanylate cyclase [Leptolyngbyaceae cyanobacterium]